jgi:6-methylsalicylate decarboxylase
MRSPGRIDVHFHIAPEFYREAVFAAGAAPAMGKFPDASPARAFEVMDANNMELAITSIAAPGIECLQPGKAREMARKCNEYAAELSVRYPSRFGAFGLIPMHDMKHAVEEIDHALGTLNFDGVFLFTSYGERFLGDPIFDPVLDALNQHGAVVFIHPGLRGSNRSLNLPYPQFLMEYTFETTRVATHLLFTGALEKFPRIRFLLAHAGGNIPYIAYRLSIGPLLDVQIPQLSHEKIYAALRRFWYDTALVGPEAMVALARVADLDQVVFGSDFPFATPAVVADGIRMLSTESTFTDAQRAAIDRDNALKLFPLNRSLHHKENGVSKHSHSQD